MLTPHQKGVIAETAVIHEAVKYGLGVWVPVSGPPPPSTDPKQSGKRHPMGERR